MITPEDRQHLMNISDAIDEIDGYSQYESYDTFIKDEMAKESVTRQLQNIGGASKMLSDDFKSNYGDIDWDTLIRLEDAMYSQAEEVEFHGIWAIMKEDLPRIRTQVNDIAANIGEEEDIQGTLPAELNL